MALAETIQEKEVGENENQTLRTSYVTLEAEMSAREASFREEEAVVVPAVPF